MSLHIIIIIIRLPFYLSSFY